MRTALRAPAFLATALIALAPSLALTDETLVKFKGGIGVDSVSAAPGPAPTSAVVNRNIVRGVQPAVQLWTIADFKAEVKADGHISAVGRGLVFAGGNTVGTAVVVTSTGGTATLNVFATLICENLAPFVERDSMPVPLAANGDFRIDGVLAPWPPANCNTPVLLIRNASNRNWFAAGILQFDEED